jgi:hypothetical protein
MAHLYTFRPAHLALLNFADREIANLNPLATSLFSAFLPFATVPLAALCECGARIPPQVRGGIRRRCHFGPHRFTPSKNGNTLNIHHYQT